MTGAFLNTKSDLKSQLRGSVKNGAHENKTPTKNWCREKTTKNYTLLTSLQQYYSDIFNCNRFFYAPFKSSRVHWTFKISHLILEDYKGITFVSLFGIKDQLNCLQLCLIIVINLNFYVIYTSFIYFCRLAACQHV